MKYLVIAEKPSVSKSIAKVIGAYMEQIFPLLGVRLISINDNYDSSNYNGTTLGMDLVVSNLVTPCTAEMQERNFGQPTE